MRVPNIAVRSRMWESTAVPVPGAHLSALGYYEARPSDVVDQDILVLDVRPPAALSESRIAAAQRFDPRHDFRALAQMLPFDFCLVVVCEKGPESRQVCERLVSMGYSNVHHLVGGMRRWRAERHSVRSGMGWQSFAEPLPNVEVLP